MKSVNKKQDVGQLVFYRVLRYEDCKKQPFSASGFDSLML